MRFTKVLFILLASAVSAFASMIETVPVGNVGNVSDPVGGGGSVSYAYNMGKYEVTVSQYTNFLNAVAKTDTYALYNASMATNLSIAGIARNGSPSSYNYSVIGSPNHPITYVSWGDAARFCNWLHNGLPAGLQDSSTTEGGAYTLNGAVSDAALNAVLRNPGAQWIIPTANEWYKAAYHQPASQGGDIDDYWNYPWRSNSGVYSDQPPGATPDDTRAGNIFKNDGLANGYDDGYAVTGSPTRVSGQNYLTDIGAYTSSRSYYGTFDQGGNVYEWLEDVNSNITGTYRRTRGGSWTDSDSQAAAVLTSSRRSDPTDESFIFGFRVGSVPEPSSALLAVSIFGLLASRRSRR